MTDAPKKIWALSDRRKHWQEQPPQDGQHVWHWTEYTRTDISQARIAELEVALAAASGTITAMRENGANDEGMDEFWATEGSYYGSGGC
jgi:hypothetical protein